MAKQIINIGSSPNKGDGEPIRSAFKKINENFNELYDGNFSDPESIESNLKPITDSQFDLGSSNQQWADLYVSDFIYLNNQRLEVTSDGILFINGNRLTEAVDISGSVFSSDSTLLVDSVNSKIVGPTEPSMFIAPRLTQIEIDAIDPTPGLIVYNTTTGKFQGYAEDANNDSTSAWTDLH